MRPIRMNSPVPRAAAAGLVALLALSAQAQATTINVPADQPSIAAAVGVAVSGDVIAVAGSHSESVASTINVTQPNVSILAAPGATINLTATTVALAIYGAGGVVDGLTFTSAVPYAAAFMQVTANNVTISHTTVYGPPQALPMGGWVVNRALAVSPGVTGSQILNNTWHSLRTGSYMDNSSGTVSGNLVYDTKGGFIGDGLVTYSGNSWGPIATANEWDIVLFPTTPGGYYPDLVALSNANNGGACWDQRITPDSRKTPVYVDAAAAPGGIGSPRLPYQTIQAGISDVYPRGTVKIANGTYIEAPDVAKSLTLDGASRAGVVIDASSFADYSLWAGGNFDWTFQHFTLKGNPVNSSSYGFKLEGDNATAQLDDLLVWNTRRSAIDLNGLKATTTINNVTCQGAANGVGIGLTNCDNVTLSNITTTGNAWGGIAIYTAPGPYTPGSNGVTLTPGGNSLGEAIPLYSESDGVNAITNVSISPSEFGFLVGSSAAPNYRFYYTTEPAALAAVVTGGAANGWIQNRNTSVYVVDPPTGMKCTPALTVAAVNSTLDLRAGTVEEQVVITTNGITIDGAGVGSSTIQSPTTLATVFVSSGNPYKPIVASNGAQDVILRDLTVNGLGRGNANNRFTGVAFWNGDGKLLDSRVTAVRDNPFSGAQHGVAVYANNNVAGAYNVEVGNSTLDDWQKNGTVFAGAGAVIDIHDCTITGQGPTATTAQNCVQYSNGASGSIVRCAISNAFYTPETVTATGVLIFGATPITMTDLTGSNGIDNCQVGVYGYDTNLSINGLDVATNVASPESYGVFFYNDTASIARPGSHGSTRNLRPAQPVDAVSLADQGGSPVLSTYTGSLTNACLDGNDVLGSAGVYVASDGGPTSFTVTNSKVKNFDAALVADGAATVLTANNNELASNLSAGYDNAASGHAQNAEENWWGDAAGPAGAGDDVVGPNVDYTPWRITNASTTVCAFTPTFTNQVGPVAPVGCISVLSGCVTVPFAISRTDNAPLRGYSATFQLGGGLTLCGANATQGSYLIGGTTFQVVNNGGGSYTIDGATLGSPCGATAPSGTLFNIYVTGSGVGTGTVTMTNLLLRDCDNVPIPGTLGAPASITIDTVPPTAIANLASVQKKTGNDSDGTTKVQVNFTAPGDAATVEVYRKGFGSYPEYDDCSGVAPSAPSYPPTGAGWTLTAVTATGQYDETTTRDFWYYTVFTKDACGNVSAVSNVTTGTLNYHLGDVTNGITPGTGDNLVATVDMTLLGSNYGITLAPHCTAAFNYLDVGPTTDFSVNGRPTTDDKVNFEDLIMFAINYGQVSFNGGNPTGDLSQGGTDARNEQPKLALVFDPASPGNVNGGTLTARLKLVDNVAATKGLHGVISFDRSKLELVSTERAGWIAQQNAFWKSLDDPKGIAIDAAALGTGVTFQGSGDVALLTFRVKQLGARPSLQTSDLRDAQNRFLAERPAGIELPQDQTSSRDVAVAPQIDVLYAHPNPFRGTTEISFSLATAGPVELRIYDASGRTVRSLQSGAMGAGAHTMTWDGRNDGGVKVGPGVYFSALRTHDRELSRKLLLVR